MRYVYVRVKPEGHSASELKLEVKGSGAAFAKSERAQVREAVKRAKDAARRALRAGCKSVHVQIDLVDHNLSRVLVDTTVTPRGGSALDGNP